MKTHVIARALSAIAFVSTLVLSSALAPVALAQDEVSGEANVEMGASQASDVEMGIGTGSSASRRNTGRAGSDGGLRLAFQLRLNAVNMLEFANVSGNNVADSAFVPFATPGVRLLDQRLFLGVGLGFNGVNVEDQDGDEVGRSGFTFSPLVSYDVLADSSAALSLLGWLNLASLGETSCSPECPGANDDVFAWGLNLGAGVRGFISEGLAIGGEFGWGLLNRAADDGDSIFSHGLFGTLLFEASVGL